MVQRLEELPEQIRDVSIQVVRTGHRLPCPLCSFHYYTEKTMDGRTSQPTVQSKYHARDEPCSHYYSKWSPAGGESFETVLEEAANSASKIHVVVDAGLSPTDEPDPAILYVEQQTTLPGL
jgi:hypothetical protein